MSVLVFVCLLKYFTHFFLDKNIFSSASIMAFPMIGIWYNDVAQAFCKCLPPYCTTIELSCSRTPTSCTHSDPNRERCSSTCRGVRAAIGGIAVMAVWWLLDRVNDRMTLLMFYDG